MANEGQPFLVQAVYQFKGKNNDELCFKKGDIITVTQFEEGGWWEGTLGDKTGWFPSNYVKEYKAQSDNLSPSKGCDASQQRVYRGVVLKDFLDSERTHVGELQNFYSVYLQPLAEKSDILSKDEYQQLVGNFKDVVSIHEEFLANIENVHSRNPGEQRVGKLLLSMAPRLKQVHHTYCAGHPRAVSVIEKHKQQLSSFCVELGGNLIKLTSGLSKPFRRMEKYSSHMQEVERHLEENHPDRGDTQRAISVYKDISSSCSVVRRQKELELEVITGGVRGWEGQDVSTLGDILYMSSVAVGPEHRDRYFALFPSTLLMLSVSHRMSAFIYEGKLPLTGIVITKLEDTDTYKNAFEISGPLIDKIVAVCQTKEDQQNWVRLLTEQCSQITAKSSPLPPVHRKPRNIIDEVPSNNTAWTISRLRPSPPSRSCLLKMDKPEKNDEKLFNEDAQILHVIEAYCSSSNSRYTVTSDSFADGISIAEKDTSVVGCPVDNIFTEDKKIVQTISGLQEKVLELHNQILSLTKTVTEEKNAREQLQSYIHNHISTSPNDLQNAVA